MHIFENIRFLVFLAIRKNGSFSMLPVPTRRIVDAILQPHTVGIKLGGTGLPVQSFIGWSARDSSLLVDAKIAVRATRH
jgi:hypothetical protein